MTTDLLNSRRPTARGRLSAPLGERLRIDRAAQSSTGELELG
ncbi:MAG: hypothetical protein OEM15_04430 [Myxococcales bacterium]|nr:hypothetical protein [Myxococcales bacterium]MDH3484083.1 hypothetical protein [Myxococcales bacterium]